MDVEYFTGYSEDEVLIASATDATVFPLIGDAILIYSRAYRVRHRCWILTQDKLIIRLEPWNKQAKGTSKCKEKK